MERLAETTPMCPEEIVAEFNKKFKGHSDEDIALPVETNGLHKIKIYRGSTHVNTPLDTPVEDGQSSITIRMS
jgi:hypothetical protein